MLTEEEKIFFDRLNRMEDIAYEEKEVIKRTIFNGVMREIERLRAEAIQSIGEHLAENLVNKEVPKKRLSK